MPRKAALPSQADDAPAPGGVAAVDRALTLLAAWGPGDQALSLAELAQRTRLVKSTVLRLLASLQHAGFLQRLADGRWQLGPQLARLAALRTASVPLEALVMPALQALVAQTQESAALHVRHGDQRLCLHRVDSPQVLRDHIRVGELLPLDRGAGGRVLMAFSGARGRLYDEIRRDGVWEREGDRVPGLAGVSAPVWGAGGTLVGALTLTFPAGRRRAGFAAQVKAAARRLSQNLGADLR